MRDTLNENVTRSAPVTGAFTDTDPALSLHALTSLMVATTCTAFPALTRLGALVTVMPAAAAADVGRTNSANPVHRQMRLTARAYRR